MLLTARALLSIAILTRQEPVEPPLLPRPAAVVLTTDAKPFELSNPVLIVVPRGSRRVAEIGELLADAIRRRTHFTVRVTNGPTTKRSILLDTALQSTNAEAYTLTVDEKRMVVHGASSKGALWGVQTLRQLLPPSFEDNRGARRKRWPVAAISIEDAPRFGWRGSMVDVSRHFFPVLVIERHIDVLSRYKMNVFHWHLTDDQGWRVEIKRYPKLTSFGAWRIEADSTRYGGFYTQQDIRRVVEYARRRGVTVVPEIEMPGHSVAAIAAYPELGCTNEQLAVDTQWGVHADVLCIGNERTLDFVKNVLGEIITLFPSQYIHIGGDEAPKDRWRACATCQDVMKREGLTTEDELQRWFIGQVGAFLESRGKRLVGWNEILQGGHLMAGAVVQSWQDSSWTRRAVSEGHDVIASPEQWTYLSQSAGDISFDRVYAFEPVPPGLDSTAAQHILGGEVAIWTEHIPTQVNLELMSYPRILAFAEVMWSSRPRDVASLRSRIDGDHAPRLRAAGIAVGPADAELFSFGIGYDSISRRPRIRVRDQSPGVVLRMSSSGRPPSVASPVVADSALLDLSGVTRLQPFYGTEAILAERVVIVDRHLAVGARAMPQVQPNRQYRGTGRWNLTDGLLGSTDHADGSWQGWWGPDVDVLVTLDSVTVVRSIGVEFLQNIRSWIVLPRQVEISWSSDSVTWSAPIVVTHTIPISAEAAQIQPFMVKLPDVKMRYLRVVGRNSGALPPGHPGAGSPSWLFADEIVVH